MLTEELQTGFSDLALRNLARWSSDEVLKRLEMTAESAAYATLENAGVLWRSNPEHTSLVRLTSLPEEDLRRLTLDACRYANDFSIPEPVLGLLSINLLEPEDIERCEHVFEQIDGLDAVIDLAAELTSRKLETDDELLRTLSKSRQHVAALLDKFAERPDIAEIASRAVLTQRDPVYLLDGRPADWFTSLRLEDETSSLERVVVALSFGPGSISTRRVALPNYQSQVKLDHMGILEGLLSLVADRWESVSGIIHAGMQELSRSLGIDSGHAVALSSPGIQASQAKNEPDLSWEFTIPAEHITWLNEPSKKPAAEPVKGECYWYGSANPRLELFTSGMFLRGQGYKVTALWFDANNLLISQSQTITDRAPLILSSAEQREPMQSDQLFVLHTKMLPGSEEDEWAAVVRIIL